MESRTDFMSRLISAGHAIPTHARGVIGRSRGFEEVVAGLSRSVRLRIEDDAPVEFVAFPPLNAQIVVENTGYAQHFPELVGSVRVAHADQPAPASSSGDVTESDWTDSLHNSGMMLMSSACHAIFGMLAHQHIHHPRRFDLVGQCFRYEPSDDPARLVTFRMHEQVMVAAPDQSLQHRDRWRQQLVDLTTRLGLDVHVDGADDPFYGWESRDAGEPTDSLKHELLAPISGDEPTAIASLNAHRDHFGRHFSIQLPDGSPAHSSCAVLGLERTTLALLSRHGMNIDRWPGDVLSVLGL